MISHLCLQDDNVFGCCMVKAENMDLKRSNLLSLCWKGILGSHSFHPTRFYLSIPFSTLQNSKPHCGARFPCATIPEFLKSNPESSPPVPCAIVSTIAAVTLLRTPNNRRLLPAQRLPTPVRSPCSAPADAASICPAPASVDDASIFPPSVLIFHRVLSIISTFRVLDSAMGNPKQKWTSEEEEALRAGVAKHGTGKWKNIQKDPEFNHFLYSRSNIDLKDKWRNMSVSANGQGPREKSRTPKPKANTDSPATTPLAITWTPGTSATPAVDPASTDVQMDDSSKCLLDGKTASKYNTMIYEALSTLKDPNGSDTSAIVSFIEKRHEVPQNFRRLLSSRLRRLVAQDKLEKVQNCYRLRREVVNGTKVGPVSKPKEIRPRISQVSSYLGGTLEEAAVSAAYQVAEAENKSFVAAEAVKEAERVSKLAEEAEAFLQLAKEIYERCSRGEVMLVA
ncbi:hypothetical protein LXL04_002396 [Taraxacum kok-saghyz]